MTAGALLLIATVPLTALTLRRPGWSRRPAKALLAAAVVVQVVVGLGIVLSLDGYLARGVMPSVAPWAERGAGALFQWFTGPTLPLDLLAVSGLVVHLLADLSAPHAARPARLRAWALGRLNGVRHAFRAALLVLPLFCGWIDVVGATSGQLGAAAARSLASLAPQASASLVAPHPHIPAFGWWLAAVALASAALPVLVRRSGRWTLGIAAAAGLLGWTMRSVAVTLAAPAFVVLAMALVGAVWWRSRGAGPAMLERAVLLGTLALALALRWHGFGEPLSPDASGYFGAAVQFHARVAASGINPIALIYLNMHEAAREPFFPVVERLVLDVLGESDLHVRYLTVFAAVAAVYVTYWFGKVTLGVAPGLIAAFLVAVQPWHIEFSQKALREEVALIQVYALALLVVLRLPATPATAIVAGMLAAFATLTRLDSAPTVGFLLVVWTVAQRATWRRALLSWGTLILLVVPLVAGYRLTRGDSLAPMGSAMGGDMHSRVDPLLRGEYGPLELSGMLAAGTLYLYGETVFGHVVAWLRPLVGSAALPAVLGVWAGGLAVLLARGPRLPAYLALLGAYIPPFAFIAARGVGPDEPYTHRYVYLVLPAALSIFGWALQRSVLWAHAFIRRFRSPAQRRQIWQAATLGPDSHSVPSAS